MTSQETQRKPNVWTLVAVVAALVVLAAAVVLLGGSTLSDRWKLVVVALGGGKAASGGHHGEGDDPHAGHANDAAGKDAIELDEQAQQNIGLEVAVLKLKPFLRTISIPAMIVEVPGRSRLRISAPLTGIVTRIYPAEGQAVGADVPLFDLRLTHEELVQAQSEFLRVSEQLKVAKREVARLKDLSQDGGLGRSRLREHIYEQEKLAADLRARRQGLQLHGLSARQVDEIQRSGTLLAGLTVYSPSADHQMMKGPPDGILQVDELNVQLGQHAEIGTPLATLTNYSRLLIQGKAFDQDAEMLRQTQQNGWPLVAVVNAGGRRREVLSDLRILRVATGIDTESRALDFYVQFENELLDAPDASADDSTDESTGPRYLYWKHRPGQRVQLQVTVERHSQRLVLPVDALVEDGAQRYVFVQVRDTFRRRSVHVLDRNQDRVLIADDGSLDLGESVVVSGAYLIHLAIKKKAGEGGGGGHGHIH